jgi:replicative DNA helicase
MDSVSSLIDPRKIYNMFRGRMDRVAVYGGGRVVSMQIKRGEWEIIERIKAHLAGQSRLGIYNHLQENQCLWAAVIFEESTGNPTARDSLFLQMEAAKLGLRGVKRERTKVKGENYQDWFFFEKPLSTKKVKHLLNLIIRKLGITKVEILPSEDELTTGAVGNFAWLPFFGGIDKWLTGEGEARVDLGVKQGATLFLDDEGAPEKDPMSFVYRLTEEDVDNAITYLHDYIPAEPSPDEGIRIQDSHLRKLAEKCEAFKGMQIEIMDKRILGEDGINYLGVMMSSFNRTDYYHKILSKTAEYEKTFYDKKLQSLSGCAFPTCISFKTAGYCPQDKVCFEKRPPIIEKFGKFEEDKNKPPEVWREPSPALWIFQSIKERMGEEEDTETVVIDADIRSQEEFVADLEKEILEKRMRLIKSKRNFSGLDTGFTLFNQVLDGLRPDSLIVLAGPSGIGKTAFCSQVAEQAASVEDTHCCYISYGESKSSISIKTLARLTGMDYRKIGRSLLSDEELQKIKQAHEKIKSTFGKTLYIVEGNDSLGIKKLREIMDFMNCRLIVIDSLQTMPFISKNVQSIDTISRIEQIMLQLKTLSRYKRIPIIATHTPQDKEATQGPHLSLDALVMNLSDVFIQMSEKMSSTGETGSGVKEINFHVKKNRGGDKNIVLKFSLQPLLQKFAEGK